MRKKSCKSVHLALLHPHFTLTYILTQSGNFRIILDLYILFQLPYSNSVGRECFKDSEGRSWESKLFNKIITTRFCTTPGLVNST